MSDICVTDNVDASRWEAHDGVTLVGFAEYVVRGDTIVFTHTRVPEEFGGQGIAGRIVHVSLEDARASGRRVVARCEYYAGWIAQHPEYGDLVASATAR